ncbi:MAG TPA: hypothetical protein VN449_02175, partial [Gaiellaceae bacterium]|nr:hypothetical protein [Gaiellaceae bacterium]
MASAVAVYDCGEIGQSEVEEVVARDHEQIVVAPNALEHEGDVADRPQAVVVGDGPVVVHGHAVAAACPAMEVRCETLVGDDVD